MAMRISVLIATRDRPNLLDKCIASLLGNTRPPAEIIIADQSDGPETETLTGRYAGGSPRLRYLRLARRGKSRALNRAIQVSGGELLALTDDDVQVGEHWIETIEKLAAEYPQAAAFCGRVLAEPGSDPSDYYNLVLSTTPRWITRATNPLTPGFCGANLAVRRSAMLAVGGYNTHFGPGGLFRNNDDGELAYRLVRDGGRLRFAPELFVYHSSWRREQDNDALKLQYTYSLGAFAGYYLRRGQLRPTAYLAKKGLFKARQLALGLAARRRTQVEDARIQITGLLRGLFRGLAVAEAGTMPAAAGTVTGDR